MAYQHAVAGHQGRYADPTIRKIGTSDVFDILAKGVADSNEKPSHFFFLTLIYPLVILFLAGLAFGDVMPASIGEFAHQVFNTWEGWTLVVVGDAVGILFGLAALTLSVVSFPQRLGHNVDASRAMWTAIRPVPGHATSPLYRKVVAW